MSDQQLNQRMEIAAKAMMLIDTAAFKTGFVDGFNRNPYQDIPDTEISTFYAWGRLCGTETSIMLPSAGVTKITSNRTIFIASVAECLCREVVPPQIGIEGSKVNNREERVY